MSNTLKKAVVLDGGSRDPNNPYSLRYTSGYFILKDKIETILKKSYSVQKNDKLYIVPGTAAPRFKVKKLTEEFDIKSVKNVKSATVVFADNKSLYKAIDTYNYGIRFLLFKEHFLPWLRTFASLNSELIDFITNNPDCEIYATGWFSSRMAGMPGGFCCNYVENDDEGVTNKYQGVINCEDIGYQHISIVKPESETMYLSLISHPHLYHVDCIRQLSSKNSVVLDKEMYESLRSLLSSGNTQDQIIAMESMANSNYDESAAYILLLFYEFGRYMWDNPARSHVNFKSLFNYFHLNRGFILDIDDCIEGLKRIKMLNEGNLNIIMEEAFKVLKENADTQYFKVEKITPSDDIKDIVYENNAQIEVDALESNESPSDITEL